MFNFKIEYMAQFQRISIVLVSKSKLGYLLFKIETHSKIKQKSSIVDQTPISFSGNSVFNPKGPLEIFG